MGLFPMSATQVIVCVVMAVGAGASLGLIVGLWLCGYSLRRLDHDSFRDDEL